MKRKKPAEVDEQIEEARARATVEDGTFDESDIFEEEVTDVTEKTDTTEETAEETAEEAVEEAVEEAEVPAEEPKED